MRDWRGIDSSIILITAKFEIYGEEFEWDCSLNWSASSGEIDQRINDWFLHCYNEAHWKFREEVREDARKRKSAQLEANERLELQRLKSKYEGA